jgi:hypothetical protein
MKSLYQEASKIFAACEEQGIIVRSLSRSRTEYFEGAPLISHYTKSDNRAQIISALWKGE